MLIHEATKTVEQWNVFELVLKGTESGNPYRDITLEGAFTNKGRTLKPEGFYDGNGIYKIRFMPDMLGTWTYITNSNCSELDFLQGEFICTEASGSNHGPVRVRNTYHFAYEDGTRYYPFGTTCYAWTHQGDKLEEQTLITLAESPFNKLRMCVFPKHYDYNLKEPEYYPFEGSLEKGWDFERFNPEFFRHLEMRIENLLDLGVEADLILFHAYDRWGFSTMEAEIDDRYLHYIVARLAAFRNIWWSFANEYDLLLKKSLVDWERFASIIVAHDPYQHLRSIHNAITFYNHHKPWITHCSIQRVDAYKSTELVDEWRVQYRKPVVVDECSYEGNIYPSWGNITGMELVRRFWEGTVRGGYVTHGETYVHPEDILWWSHGGVLHGDSPARIAFLRKIIEDTPEQGLTCIPQPLPYGWDVPCRGTTGDYYLFYFGYFQPSFRLFSMPQGLKLKVDIIDTWNMTIEELPDTYEGDFRIEMPGRLYMAVRMRKF
jgi:hypothetical protein